MKPTSIRVPVPHPNGGIEEVLVDLRDDVLDELQQRVSDLGRRYGRRVPAAFDVYLGPVEWMSLVEDRETDRRAPPEEVELDSDGEIRLIRCYFQQIEVHCYPGTADGIHFRLPAWMCLQEWARTRVDRVSAPNPPPPTPEPRRKEHDVVYLDEDAFRWWSSQMNQDAWIRSTFGLGDVLLPTAAPDSHPLYDEKPPKADASHDTSAEE